MEFELLRDRHAAIGSTVVQSPRAESAMSATESRSLPGSPRFTLDLYFHGIRIEIDETTRRAVLVKRSRRAVQVDNEIGGNVETVQLRLASCRSAGHRATA